MTISNPLYAQNPLLEYSKIDKMIEDISLHERVTLLNEKDPQKLPTFASALRRKKVALFWAKVYVGEFFSSTPVDLTNSETTLKSLENSPWVVITMQFLRDVSNDKILNGFKDALAVNGHHAESDEFKSLFESLKKTGNLNNKDKLALVFHKKQNQETLSVEVMRANEKEVDKKFESRVLIISPNYE